VNEAACEVDRADLLGHNEGEGRTCALPSVMKDDVVVAVGEDEVVDHEAEVCG
jgi:hypothetical protein